MWDWGSFSVGWLIGALVAGVAVWLAGRVLFDWAANRSTSKTLVADPQSAVASQQIALVAQQALYQNSGAFLQMVRTELDGQFGREREALSGTVAPLKESLAQVQGLIRSIEEERNKAFGSLRTGLDSLGAQTASLQRETTTLASALRNPQTRGRWGEVALRRLVELAGMTEHADFETQVSLAGVEERLRPDLITYLPNERMIPVDSKVSIAAYLDALEATTPEQRQALFEKHADQVRTRLRELSSKEYAEGLRAVGKSPEFTIMFIPGDDFLAAALSADPDLFEDGASKNVMLASPTILLPLLRVVEVGWRQERFLENVEGLRDEARTLYDRLAGLTDRLGTLGKRLEGAVKEYNAFVGSFDSRVVPQARKFEAMGVKGSKSISDIAQIELLPRQPKPSFGVTGTLEEPKREASSDSTGESGLD